MNLLFPIIFILLIIRSTIISTYFPKSIYNYDMTLLNDILYVVLSGVSIGLCWYLARCIMHILF